jgi:drug/metabolite transporter (DMT)-like permease
MKFIWLGIVFAFLWASAAAATKIGLQSAQPFVLAVTRFAIAGILMTAISHVFMGNRLPRAGEWRQIMIYGLLNITIYLGLYVLAMQTTSAGLASLAIAINPVLISFMASLLFGHRITGINVISLILCSGGVLLAAYPLLENSYSTPEGLGILLICMVAYSGGAIYYSRSKWNNLDILTINGWQTLFGGLFLLPFAALSYKGEVNKFDFRFFGSVLWLAIPVSIAAVQAWMVLLKRSPVSASYWLYLCPVFGFLIAAITLHEPLSIFTAVGVAMVIFGLWLVQKYKAQS